MFCVAVFTCLTKEKQAKVTGCNPKNMHFFDIEVALFWTLCNKTEKRNCAYLTNYEKER